MPEDALGIRVVSGGQTGVDRAALDTALAFGIPCGGWVPRGRRAEDGRLPDRYPMREARTPAYGERTRLNVRDSDGTLILTRGTPFGSTALTLAVARGLGRPALVVDFDCSADHAHVLDWIRDRGLAVLNVAGPRESTSPGIYHAARAYLENLFGEWLGCAPGPAAPRLRNNEAFINCRSPDGAR